MAPGYVQQAGLVVEFGEPVLLIITFYRAYINNQTGLPDYVIKILTNSLTITKFVDI
jgi:hypothetical protein